MTGDGKAVADSTRARNAVAFLDMTAARAGEVDNLEVVLSSGAILDNLVALDTDGAQRVFVEVAMAPEAPRAFASGCCCQAYGWKG